MRQAEEFLDWLYGPEGGGSDARPHLVLEWVERHLGDDDGPLFWEVVTKSWSSFDLIPHEDFEGLFARFVDSAPKCEPTRMTVFRGQNAGAPLGLSWTLDRKVAEEFARGHRGIRNRHPVVLERVVTRDQVAFVCDDREEKEIVLLAVPD